MQVLPETRSARWIRCIIYIFHHWVDTSAGGLLFPQVIIRPVVRTTLLKLNKHLQGTHRRPWMCYFVFCV